MGTGNLASNDWKANVEIDLTDALKEQHKYKLLKYLGGGATSHVWLACELGTGDSSTTIRDTTIREAVAIKVLKPESERLWREAFEDEIDVLNQLGNAEKDRGDGERAIPVGHTVSKKGDSPAFLVMEYVPFPSVDTVAAPSDNLPQRLDELQRLHVSFKESLDALLDKTKVIWASKPDLETMVKELQSNDQKVDTGTGQLSQEFTNWLNARRGLNEEEVIVVGQQICRVLQLLHEAGRGYQDFQLHNVRYDQERRRIKIIDWNVVTPKNRVNLKLKEGLEDVQQDLFKLAQYLFWLRTQVMPPPGGALVRTLARLGGAPWSSQTSLALRLVLERALDPNPARRYPHAFDFEPGADPDQSLGLALTRVSEWYAQNTTDLLQAAEQEKARNRGLEALAIIELAQQRVLQEAPAIREVFLTNIKSLLSDLGELTKRPDFEEGQRRLHLFDAAGAIEQFAAAMRADPDDLEATRWHALAQRLQTLSLDNYALLWKSGKVQAAMQALTEERWSAAEALFKDASLSSMFPALLCDARIGQTLSRAEKEWGVLQQGSIEVSDAKAAAQRLLNALGEADRLQQKDQGPPLYLEVLLQRWPERETWRTLAKNIVVEPEEIEALEKLFRSNAAQALERCAQLFETYPDNADLVRLAIDQVEQFLTAGQPENARELFQTAYDRVGPRFKMSELRRWGEIAQAWEKMQRRHPALQTITLGRPA